MIAFDLDFAYHGGMMMLMIVFHGVRSFYGSLFIIKLSNKLLYNSKSLKETAT